MINNWFITKILPESRVLLISIRGKWCIEWKDCLFTVTRERTCFPFLILLYSFDPLVWQNSWLLLDVLINLLNKDWHCWLILALAEESPHGVVTKAFKTYLNWHHRGLHCQIIEAEIVYLWSIYPSTIILDRQIQSKKQIIHWMSR